MTTLTYSSGRIHLGVGAFILSLILSSMGCEEAVETSCVETYYDCQEAIPPADDPYSMYCGLIPFLITELYEAPPTDKDILRACKVFRAGQVCQCLSGCFAGLEDEYLDMPPDEADEVSYGVHALYCSEQYRD